MNVEIVRASPRHIRPMARQLRAAACVSIKGYGFDPRRALHKAFLTSPYCRTALVDEKPVAMWGVVAPLMSEAGYVWLVMSQDIARLPHTVGREARKELAEIMRCHQEVATTVLPEDDAAIRFALHLGFHDRHEDSTGGRKAMARALLNDPKHRIPIGDSWVIGLGYHGGPD